MIAVLAGQLDLLELLADPASELAPTPAPEPEQGMHGKTGPGAAWQRTVAQWPDFSPVTWTAPWDCGDGTPKGTVLPAVRCPFCLQIEVNDHMLSLSHGIAFDRPESWQPGPQARTTCARQRLTASQAASARARGLATYTCRHCRIHTCSQLVNTGAHSHPYSCAGERPGHDWRPDTSTTTCVLPGCHELVPEAGQPCAGCREAFGEMLRHDPDGATLTPEQVIARDQATRDALREQIAARSAATGAARKLKRKQGQTCWLCTERRTCTQMPNGWECDACRDVS